MPIWKCAICPNNECVGKESNHVGYYMKDDHNDLLNLSSNNQYRPIQDRDISQFPKKTPDRDYSDFEIGFGYHTVTKPEHYNKSGIECIKAIEASMTKEEFEGYLKGNVLKYVWRYKYKNKQEDLEKAAWYLNLLKETYGKKQDRETQA